MNRNIRLLYLFNFFTDFKLYAPVAIIYFSRVSGSFALGMSIFSVIYISSAIFEVPTGIFSDLIGRKKTIMAGAACAFVYAVLYAVGENYWWLFVGAIFEGISRAWYSGNNDAFLHDTLREAGVVEKYPKYFGRATSMFETALAASAFLGSFFVSWSLPLLMWLSVIPQMLCFLISLFFQDVKIKENERANIYNHLKESLHNFDINPRLRLLAVAEILRYGFGETGYNFQSAFYQMLWPLWAVNLIKALNNVLASISFNISHLLMKKFSTVKLMLTGFVYSRISNIIALLFPSVASPLLMASNSLFFGIVVTGQNTLFQKEFSEKQRATMGSLKSFGGSIFFALCAFLIGLAADKIGPIQAFLVLQFLQFSVIWLYLRILKKENSSNA